MSEFQYVGFRAVDAPLTDEQLQYMERQSSRAQVTRWSFDNTYHYGNFRGNADEMLRRGYDVFLHYAVFGIRTLKIRVPFGLPSTKARCSKYLDGDMVNWQPDDKGRGGILSISATGEYGTEDALWDLQEYLDRIVGVRRQLLDGDLRPLYVAWMCGCRCGDVQYETKREPPVPAGLGEASDAILGMLAFFELGAFELTAAAESSPPLPSQQDQEAVLKQWLHSLDTATLRKWLSRFLVGEPMATRSECLRVFRGARKLPPWPTVAGRRTFAQLLERADKLAKEARHRKEIQKERARQQRLTEMARLPKKYLNQVDELVAMRGSQEYNQAAQILCDLRDAVGGDKGDKLARKHAAHLNKKHPTLNKLTGALRRKKLLP